jgi:hypothetical protein
MLTTPPEFFRFSPPVGKLSGGEIRFCLNQDQTDFVGRARYRAPSSRRDKMWRPFPKHTPMVLLVAHLYLPCEMQDERLILGD